jgi:hypothetical protein
VIASLRARPGGLPLGAILLAGGVLGGAAVSVFGLDRLPFPVCAFKAITGIPCLTCGSTRAVGLLFAGDVWGALAMNPLTTLVVFGVGLWGLADLVLLLRRSALEVKLSRTTALVVQGTAVALLIANWAYLIAVRR